MKKLVSFAMACLILFMTGIVAFADLGSPMFDEWYVICGPKGFSYVDVPYHDTPEGTDLSDYIKPGEKLLVHSYNSSDKKYLLLFAEGNNHPTKGIGFVYVTENELKTYFSGTEKPVSKDYYANKPDKEITCVVTSDDGLMLRQGPGTDYKAYATIPYNTKLTYRYVAKMEDYDWGCVTYKGQEGWCCLKYTQDVAKTTAPSTTAAEEKTTKEDQSTAETTTVDEITTIPEENTSAVPEGLTREATETSEDIAQEAPSFFSQTKNVVIVCCLGAIVLAATAVVVLVTIRRRRY
ncbi:MAG: SH3 domain-containing protein [Clostridia bacterium]|nr:SH3 domain-containing protein [Clostridia bacterium]